MSKNSGTKLTAVPPGYEQMLGIDPDEMIIPLAGVGANGDGWDGPTPILEDEEGSYHFSDYPDFQPTLSPATVLRLGSFGGGYFRPITSTVTGVHYKHVWRELPEEWLEEIDVATFCCSETYNKKINKYKQNCGAKEGKQDPFGLVYWESKNWITSQDPYGWFHWYTRFFRGRRSADDRRQIDRWKRVCGERGRWKMNLIGKVLSKHTTFDDNSVSPVVRQTLQHWAYTLTRADFKRGAERVRERGAAYMPKATLKAAGVMKGQKNAPKKRKRRKVGEGDGGDGNGGDAGSDDGGGGSGRRKRRSSTTRAQMLS